MQIFGVKGGEKKRVGELEYDDGGELSHLWTRNNKHRNGPSERASCERTHRGRRKIQKLFSGLLNSGLAYGDYTWPAVSD